MNMYAHLYRYQCACNPKDELMITIVVSKQNCKLKLVINRKQSGQVGECIKCFVILVFKTFLSNAMHTYDSGIRKRCIVFR